MTSLKQKEYSNYIKNGLLQEFPNFTDHLKTENDIIKIEYPSTKRTAILWITTQNSEITIGFDDISGDCSWHTHMSSYGANEPEEQLRVGSELIKNILYDIEILVMEADRIIDLTKNPKNEIEKEEDKQNLEFRRWSEV